jgi:hypothetical protein
MRSFEFSRHGKKWQATGPSTYDTTPLPLPDDATLGVSALAKNGTFGTLGALLVTHQRTINDPDYYHEPETVARFLDFDPIERRVGLPLSVTVTGWGWSQLKECLEAAGLRVFEDRDLEG